jgi:hypothetical protein
MPSCNDAKKPWIAVGNCACCAVGGLAGQSANTIMAKVYAEVSVDPPGGTSADDDGGAAFALYGAKYSRKAEKPVVYLDEHQDIWPDLQVEGICEFLKRRAILAKVFGTPKKPLTIVQAMDTISKWAEKSLFLVFTGIDDGWGIGRGAHWTVGQIQDEKAQFYDYQLKTTDEIVTQQLKKSKSFKDYDWGETAVSDLPPAPFGQKLREDDGAVVLLRVRKGQ